MARRAHQAGKLCAIGSNLETDLGQAVMVCLASSVSAFPVERYDCNLMGALFYESSSVPPPIVSRYGRVRAPSGPGFGVVPSDVHVCHGRDAVPLADNPCNGSESPGSRAYDK